MLHPSAISYEVCELHAARNRLLKQPPEWMLSNLSECASLA